MPINNIFTSTPGYEYDMSVAESIAELDYIKNSTMSSTTGIDSSQLSTTTINTIGTGTTGYYWNTIPQGGTSDIVGIESRLAAIERQLLILTPVLEMHEKYPALKEAYDAYMVLLKLVGDTYKKS